LEKKEKLKGIPPTLGDLYGRVKVAAEEVLAMWTVLRTSLMVGCSPVSYSIPHQRAIQ